MYEIDKKLVEMANEGTLKGSVRETPTRAKFKKVTASLDNYFDNPSKHIITHFEYIDKAPLKTEFSNTERGAIFEDLFLQALINYKGGAINIRSLNLGKKVRIDFPLLKTYRADIDILINKQIAFMVKTSLRERWRQWHSDMAPIRGCYLNEINPVYCVFFKEKPNSSVKSTIKEAYDTFIGMFIKPNDIITVYDIDSINNLFDHLVELTNTK